MSCKSLLKFVFVASISLTFSCSAHQRPSPLELVADDPSVEESLVGAGVSGSDVSAEQSDERARQALQKVVSDATALWQEGLLLAYDGDLERAREKIDTGLNAILESGLALDAYPELHQLFQKMSNEAIAIDELLAQADSAVQESTLVDELEEVKSDEEVGKTEEASPVVTYDLPVVINNRVRQFIERFQTERRDVFAEGIVRSGRYLEMFKRILREEGLPTDLAYMPQIESTYKVRAYSRAKAMGIWQFMSWTGKRCGLRIDSWIDERSDPERACQAAARYLKELHRDLGDWLLAIAAYNGGPGRVGYAVRRMGTKDFWKISGTSRYLRLETRNFVPAVLAAIIIMKQPKEYGFGDVTPDPLLKYDKVKIDSATDLRIAADLAGVSVTDLQELNPALRSLVTPVNYSGYELKIPAGTKKGFEERYAALPPQKRLKYTEHTVRSGETLSLLAKRYGTTISAIQHANNISNPHRLAKGQRLIVPLSPLSGSSQTYVSAGVSPGTRLTYTVRRGDSLYKIARAYGTTVNSLAIWNNLNPRVPIYPGDRLAITAGTRLDTTSSSQISGKKIVHSVQRGDTLYDIAIRYRTSVTQLKRWNNLSRNLIRPGDRLTIYLEGGEGNNN